MNNTDHTLSARAYIEEVSSILTDLPTPSINAAVMRGAGLRFSFPGEGHPGPRRLVLDGPSAGHPLATGMTAAALLARQRGNLAYFYARRERLGREAAQAFEVVTVQNPSGWNDYALEVMAALRRVPLLAESDFTNVFGKLSAIASVGQRGASWEVREVGGDWTGMSLETLGNGFSVKALRAATRANAERYSRWRRALRTVKDLDDGADATAPKPAAALATPSTGSDDRPCQDSSLSHTTGEAQFRHHHRSLSADKLRERRRRFPELFVDIAFTGPSVVADRTTVGDRRRRFPELFTGHVQADDSKAEGEFEIG